MIRIIWVKLTQMLRAISLGIGSWRRLYMDDRIRDLRKCFHQPILHDMREPVSLMERGLASEPHVQIEERVVE